MSNKGSPQNKLVSKHLRPSSNIPSKLESYKKGTFNLSSNTTASAKNLSNNRLSKKELPENSSIKQDNQPQTILETALNTPTNGKKLRFSGSKELNNPSYRMSVKDNASPKFRPIRGIRASDMTDSANKLLAKDVANSRAQKIKQNQLSEVETVQNLPLCELEAKEKQYQQKIARLESQIAKLKSKNEELTSQLNKYKIASQQNRKQLCQKILSFNQGGQELRKAKQTINTLTNQVNSNKAEAETFQESIRRFTQNQNVLNSTISKMRFQLQQLKLQNILLKNKYEKDCKEIQESFLRYQQQRQQELSRCSTLPIESSIRQNDQKDSQFTQMFQKMHQQYTQNLKEVEDNYYKLVEQLKSRLHEYQIQNFDLSNQLSQRLSSSKISSIDDRIFKIMKQNNELKKKLNNAKQINLNLQQDYNTMSILVNQISSLEVVSQIKSKSKKEGSTIITMQESRVSTQKNNLSKNLLFSSMREGNKFGFRSGKLIKKISLY